MKGIKEVWFIQKGECPQVMSLDEMGATKTLKLVAAAMAERQHCELLGIRTEGFPLSLIVQSDPPAFRLPS